MKHSIDKDGNLVIQTQGNERRTLRRAMKQEEFHSDQFMYETFENLIANSELEWIAPEEIGVLTDAPILGTRDEEGKPVDAGELCLRCGLGFRIASHQHQ